MEVLYKQKQGLAIVLLVMDCKTFYGKKSTCSTSLVDKLHEEHFESANIYISPPMEDSEGDSEVSGNENEGDFCEKFSQKILGAPAEATLVSHGS
ncbi:unnamed protein product [Acanthoscelides obtectus]|uniref:Uncharacterized protein n=1 Tax=Acanthoscelides obtectus TaxID=200917 RepID=A0A9P0Q7Y4_ACAOB|nr:unnamed protein product [Acanthoscelides obtectus]CAK1671618.1 hypothetical protein AOBTE_LOCUS28365 [Acanthoscelides obtectus]